VAIVGGDRELAVWDVTRVAPAPAAAEPLFCESAAGNRARFTHVNGATGGYYLPR